MKNLDFKVVDTNGVQLNINHEMLGATVFIELPDDKLLDVATKLLHSNNRKATAYNLERRICAFLTVNHLQQWRCTSLFHVPPMPNEPQPEITVVHINTNNNADSRPQSGPATV